MKAKYLIFILPLFLVNACKDDDPVVDQTVQLTEQEANDLKFLREEEKLARDVYNYAHDLYGKNTFTNIASSEQRHMDAVLTLLNSYGVTDPIINDSQGIFSNADLTKLYADLTQICDTSLTRAYYVGATIEDLDIKDIDVFMSNTDKSDVLETLGKLTCASRNHMRAYYEKLEDSNYTYTAQFISSTDLEAIINSDKENCGH